MTLVTESSPTHPKDKAGANCNDASLIRSSLGSCVYLKASGASRMVGEPGRSAKLSDVRFWAHRLCLRDMMHSECTPLDSPQVALQPTQGAAGSTEMQEAGKLNQHDLI